MSYQTSRTIGGVPYDLTFDYDNRITEVKQGATTLNTFVYDADGNRVAKTDPAGPTFTDGFNAFNAAKWQFDSQQTIVDDAGNNVVNMVGPGNFSWPGIHRTNYTVAHNQSVVVDFKMSQADTGLHLMLHSSDGDARWAVVDTGGNLVAHFIVNSQNTGWGVGGTLIANPVPNRWYRATLSVNDSSGFTVTVCERDNASVCGSWTRAMPAGKLWKFDAVINAGTASLDNFIERNDAATTTAYVSGLFEWQAGATTKYYDGGAMRRTGYPADNGISYVLGDQLGSSSKIVGQSGSLQASNYFLPFGGNRGSSVFSDLTTKRFTGQYHESGLPGGEGLSFYNARRLDVSTLLIPRCPSRKK